MLPPQALPEFSMSKPFNVVVTGAGGQLGVDLLRRAANYPRLRVVGSSSGTIDITSDASIEAAFARDQPQLVINAAAYTAVDRAESERAASFAVNCEGVRNLARACAARGIPLFHVSTDYVFDGSKATPWLPEDVASPLGVYGASKLAGEVVLREMLPQHLILRTSWVFGAHGNNFVRTMLRLARARDHLRVVADQVGGPTWSGHLADALLSLADRCRENGSIPWGTGHFAGQPFVSWHGFAGEIFIEARRCGLLARLPRVDAIATVDYPTPAQRPANSRLDMSETAARWTLAVPDWREGLRAVLAGWRRGDGYDG